MKTKIEKGKWYECVESRTNRFTLHKKYQGIESDGDVGFIDDLGRFNRSVESKFKPVQDNAAKLKHIAKFCCEPQSEAEFELVKVKAEIGGFKIEDDLELDKTGECPMITVDPDEGVLILYFRDMGETVIPVIDFCNLLVKPAEEFPIEDTEKKYTESDLIDFANCMVKKSREVTHVDLENWKDNRKED